MRRPYRKSVRFLGELTHLMVGTRPDLAYCGSKVARFHERSNRKALESTQRRVTIPSGDERLSLLLQPRHANSVRRYELTPVGGRTPTALVQLSPPSYSWTWVRWHGRVRKRQSVAVCSTEVEYTGQTMAATQVCGYCLTKAPKCHCSVLRFFTAILQPRVCTCLPKLLTATALKENTVVGVDD